MRWVFQALIGNTTGSANTAVGDSSLLANTTGFGNTANGVSALQNNTIGSFNVALGVAAGTSIMTANYVICIGASTRRADSALARRKWESQTSSSELAPLRSPPTG